MLRYWIERTGISWARAIVNVQYLISLIHRRRSGIVSWNEILRLLRTTCSTTHLSSQIHTCWSWYICRRDVALHCRNDQLEAGGTCSWSRHFCGSWYSYFRDKVVSIRILQITPECSGRYLKCSGVTKTTFSYIQGLFGRKRILQAWQISAMEVCSSVGYADLQLLVGQWGTFVDNPDQANIQGCQQIVFFHIQWFQVC
jgi:hypothetical protein